MLSILRTCHLLVFCKVFQMFASFCSVFCLSWVFVFHLLYQTYDLFLFLPFSFLPEFQLLTSVVPQFTEAKSASFYSCCCCCSGFPSLKNHSDVEPTQTSHLKRGHFTSKPDLGVFQTGPRCAKLDPAVSNCKCLLDPEDFSPCLLLTLLLPSVLLLLD